MVLVDGGYKKFASKGDVLKEITVEKGTEETLKCIYSQDAGALVKKGEENNVVQEVNLKETNMMLENVPLLLTKSRLNAMFHENQMTLQVSVVTIESNNPQNVSEIIEFIFDKPK